MAVTYSKIYDATVVNNGGGSGSGNFTSGSFTCGTDTLLVAVVSVDTQGNAITNGETPTPTTSGLTWVRHGSHFAGGTGGSVFVELYMADNASSGSKTFAMSGSGDFTTSPSAINLSVFEFTGAGTETQQTKTAGTFSASSVGGDPGAQSCNLPVAPSATSYLIGVYSGDGAGVGNTTSAGSSWTEEVDRSLNPLHTHVQLITGVTSTSVAWVDLETAASPTIFDYNLIGLEIVERPPTVEQEGFRFRNDDGSETTATWMASQDTNTNVGAVGTSVRLRMLLNANLDPASAAYKLFWKKSTDSYYKAVLTSSTAAVPTWVANGAQTINAAAITPALPAGIEIGDTLVAFFETANQATSIANGNGATWTEIGTQTGTGSAGSTGATRISAWWTRYDGVITTGPTTNDSGDHQLGFVAAFRGCKQEGSPIDATATYSTEAGPTTITIPTLTTTVGNCLVVAAVADDWDNASTTRYGSWTNGNLANISERFDSGSTTQNGGGLGMAHGDKVAAGATGTWTASAATSITVNANAAFALAPAEATIYMAASANITAGGENTTFQLTAPSGKSTSDFVTGRMWDNENGSDSIDITTNDYTELEWCITTQSPAADADIYLFRVYVGNTALATYTVTPELTIGSGSADGTATPAAITANFTIPAATPQGGAVTTVEATALPVTIPAVTTQAGAAGSPAAVSAPFTIPAPTVTGAGNVTPDAITAPFTIPAATGQRSETGVPAATSAPFTLPAVTTAAGAVATPAATTVTVTIPAVTATGSGSATATPDAITFPVTIPQATPLAGSVAQPAAISVPVTLPAATPLAGATASPAATTVVVTIPAATATGSTPGTAQPNSITATVTIPQATPAAGTVVSVAATTVAVTMPAALATASKTATPAATTVTVTIPAATASGGTSGTATPAAIPVTVTMPAPTNVYSGQARPAAIVLAVTLAAVVATGLPPDANPITVTVTDKGRTITVIAERRTVTARDRRTTTARQGNP